MNNTTIEYVDSHVSDYQTFRDFLSLCAYADLGKLQEGEVPYCFIRDGASDLQTYFQNKQDQFNALSATAKQHFNRYYNSTHYSKRTCNKRLTKMLEYSNIYNYQLVFVTFTFDNDAMDRLSSETKRRYVTRYLTNQANMIDYYGNVDYGEKNGRLHYHVIVLASGDLDPYAWADKYGAIKFKRVPLEKCNTHALGNYILKLNNHAVKLHTNGQNKLSCRKPRYDDFMKFQVIDKTKTPRKTRKIYNKKTGLYITAPIEPWEEGRFQQTRRPILQPVEEEEDLPF